MLLKESERLEQELQALTTRLVAFTEELQAQLVAKQAGGDDGPANH